jgi:uncharacterized protein YndB with AHSA1/START domain
MGESASSTDRIEKQIEINAPVSRVWKALTDHREFSAWFGCAQLDTPFAPGKASRGRLNIPGYDHLTLEVVVRAVEPERYFAFNWHPYAVDAKVDYSKEAPTLVEFFLEPVPGGTTRLRVVESGFDKVPASRRAEAFRMNSKGWEGQLKNIDRHVAPPSTTLAAP